MAFGAKTSGNGASTILRKLSSIKDGIVNMFKSHMRQVDSVEIQQALKDIARSRPSEWDDLSEKALRIRAWRGYDTDTPWIESGWLLDCIVIVENWNEIELGSDYCVVVRFADGQVGSHGVDINWLTWTLEYGGYTIDDNYIPPRPLFRIVQEQIVASGAIQKRWRKIFRDYIRNA